MKKVKLSILIIFTLTTFVSFGQSTDDVFRLSFKNRASGTARSAAMGGAFTSLGADASSININPAGLGMYRSSEISITPSVFGSRVSSEAFQDGVGSIMTKKGHTAFNVNNISAIFNVYNSDYRDMRTFTLGVSYYNDRYSKYVSQAESPATNISIGDYFSAQMFKMKPSDISNENDNDAFAVYRNNSPSLWGAIMAYNNGLLEPLETNGVYHYRIAKRSFVGSDAVLPLQRVKQRTSIDNISFSAGTNIGDMLYLGVTMGARLFEYSRESNYQEDAVGGNVGDLDQIRYFQSNKMSGSAFDFKVGATLEPFSGLKIGAAFHCPTITFIDDEYYGDMDILYRGESPYNQSTPYDPITYEIKSAPSFLAGISYRLPFAILSFDYQRTWYDKMEVRNLVGGSTGFNSELQSTYKPSDSFMAGVEVQPIKGFFVRGGYAYYGSALKDIDKKYGTTTNLSFGLGFKTDLFYLDLAYINSKYKALPFRYFGGYFANPSEPTQEVFVASESMVNQKFSDNTISLTLGFRF